MARDAVSPQYKPTHASYSVVRDGPIVALVWHGTPVLQGVRETALRMSEAARERDERKLVFLALIERGAASSPPPSEVRDALDDLLTQYDTRIAAGAIVFESTGFAAAIVRSVVGMIHTAKRRTYPREVFKNVSEAAAWCAGHAGIASERIVLCIDRARR